MAASEPAPSTMEVDPFDAGQITERLPAWELWEDGIEPDEELPLSERHDRAA
jgi:hypothetical protein